MLLLYGFVKFKLHVDLFCQTEVHDWHSTNYLHIQVKEDLTNKLRLRQSINQESSNHVLKLLSNFR